MNDNKSSKGFTIQIVNIKDSTVTTDKISTTDNETPSKEKEHASKNKSGQPPSEMDDNGNSNTFPTRLVLLLIIPLTLLLFILACCMLDENQFNMLIDFLNRYLDLFKSCIIYTTLSF